MILQSSKGFRQAAAIGLLVVALTAFTVVLALPLAQHLRGIQDNIHDQRILLGRLQKFALKKSEADRLVERSDAVLRSGFFLTGGTDALRAANLQSLLSSVAKDNGIRLRSTRALPPTTRDGWRFIGVQATMTANINQIQSLVLALESMQQYLFVQNLAIGQPASRNPVDDNLTVRIGIVGAVARDKV